MPEVEGNYECFICNIVGLTHEAWKEHQCDDGHIEKVKRQIKKRWFCAKCDHQFEKQSLFDRHCASKKHRVGQLTSAELFCSKCNTQCDNKAKWDAHILTKKHTNTRIQKTEKELFCDGCHTQCHNDSEWEKHLKTKKHNKNNTNELC